MRLLWPIAFVGVISVVSGQLWNFVSAPGIAAEAAGPEYMPICTLPKCLNPRVTAKSGIGTANATAEAKVTPEDAGKWCATYKPMDKLCQTEQVKSGWIGFRNLYRASADCVAGRMTPIDGNQYSYVGVWEDGPGKGRPKFASANGRFPAKKWDETGVEIHPSGSITAWGGGSPNLAAQWDVLCAGAPAPKVAAASAAQAVAQVPNAITLQAYELRQAADETPLQSADFGTPEATAKIAAKAGFIDVIGVKLGMPLKSALDTVKAHNANLAMEPLIMQPYEALPGAVMTPVLASKRYTKTANDQETEQIGLLVTVPPNNAVVWGVWREISFGKPDSRPTIDTILTGLRKKYGPESVKPVGNIMTWIYDAQGQPVAEAKARDVVSRCASNWEVGLALTSQLQTGYINRQIVGGYYHSSYGKDPFDGLCHAYAVVQAVFMPDPLQTSPPLVSGVMVSASNRQLEVSGITAAHTLLIREATALAEKRKGDASKREIPKF
jgi:hypothetical protein